MNKTARLGAKLHGINTAHKYAQELYDLLAPIFAPFVGQKVFKADGTLMAKFAKLLPELPCTPGLHVYKYCSDYSLMWQVKTCEQVNTDDYYCQYYEIGCYVGHIRDGVLTGMYDRPELRSDYTVEEATAKREAYEAARKVYEDAKSALHPFGEYDR